MSGVIIIVAVVVSVLILLSRFLLTCKAEWAKVPRVIAVLLPPVVLLAPHIVGLWCPALAAGNFMAWLVGALVLLVVGLLPEPAQPSDP